MLNLTPPPKTNTPKILHNTCILILRILTNSTSNSPNEYGQLTIKLWNIIICAYGSQRRHILVHWNLFHFLMTKKWISSNEIIINILNVLAPSTLGLVCTKIIPIPICIFIDIHTLLSIYRTYNPCFKGTIIFHCIHFLEFDIENLISFSFK